MSLVSSRNQELWEAMTDGQQKREYWREGYRLWESSKSVNRSGVSVASTQEIIRPIVDNKWLLPCNPQNSAPHSISSYNSSTGQTGWRPVLQADSLFQTWCFFFTCLQGAAPQGQVQPGCGAHSPPSIRHKFPTGMSYGSESEPFPSTTLTDKVWPKGRLSASNMSGRGTWQRLGNEAFSGELRASGPGKPMPPTSAGSSPSLILSGTVGWWRLAAWTHLNLYVIILLYLQLLKKLKWFFILFHWGLWEVILKIIILAIEKVWKIQFGCKLPSCLLQV